MNLKNINLPSKTRLISHSLFALSIVIFGASFLMTRQIDVIKDWVITFPQEELHAGDEVIIQSTYTKVRDAKGTAKRYIECESKPGVFIRYELNEAVADRQMGTTGTGIPVKIRSDIPELPTTCKFCIAINYRILPLLDTLESNCSNTFKLYPKRETTDEPQATIQSSQTQTPVAVVGQPSVSSNPSPTNNTPQPTPPQSNNPQPDDSTPETEPPVDQGLLPDSIPIIGGLL